jgi:hypothetical protein
MGFAFLLTGLNGRYPLGGGCKLDNCIFGPFLPAGLTECSMPIAVIILFSVGRN